MLTLESRATAVGVRGRDITDFLLTCDDDRYQAWWPGMHLRFHRLRRAAGGGPVGDVVWMDEFVGTRRLRLTAEVVDVVPGERIAWRLCPWRLGLPVWLTLELRTHEDGVALHHTITAGWPGPGRLLDPLWRLYFTRSFARDMDRHARTEFPRLAALLRRVDHGGR